MSTVLLDAMNFPRLITLLTLLSAGFIGALVNLIHRFYQTGDLEIGVGAFAAGAVLDFGIVEWALLAGTVAGCVVGVVRRESAILAFAQLLLLAAGFLLVMWRLGVPPGPKVDMRLLHSAHVGFTVLYGSYACLVAQVWCLLRADAVAVPSAPTAAKSS